MKLDFFSLLGNIDINIKCIGCDACSKVCPVDCISGEKLEKHHIDLSICTHCGDCIKVCPVDAITSFDNSMSLLNDIALGFDVIAIIAPSVRVGLDMVGIDSPNKLAGVLKSIGVKYVFDICMGADLTVIEESFEIIEKVRIGKKLPVLTSCCPSWVKMVHDFFPEFDDNISSTKSPMEILAAAIKLMLKDNDIKRNKVKVVGIMPCVAKKYEASLLTYSDKYNYDVDYVLTTNEIKNIVRNLKIDVSKIEPIKLDEPFNTYSGSGVIFGRSGGVITAVTKNIIYILKNKVEEINFSEHESFRDLNIYEVKMDDLTINIGYVNGLKNARTVLKKIREKEIDLDVLEIMACPGGCINGGGQIRVGNSDINKRRERLNEIGNTLFQIPIQNKKLIDFYLNHFDKIDSIDAINLFHTSK